LRGLVESGLNAAIGVNDEAVLASAPARRHAERVGDEHRRLGRVDRPADDEPGEGVQDDAAVELALSGRVLGDVGHPELVGPVAIEPAPDEVEGGDSANPCALGHLSRRQALDSELGHDRGDRVVADRDLAAVEELGGDPHRAVGAARGLVDAGDLAGEPDSPQGSRWVGPIPPCVVAGLGDAEDPAGVADVGSLPGQGIDHRVEPFGGRSPSRKTSLTLRETASSVSSWRIRRLAAASSSA